MRLKVVGPITSTDEPLRTEATIPDQPGTIQVRSNAIGYETTYYAVDQTTRLRSLSSEAVIDGKPTPLTRPRVTKIEIPENLTRIRLFFQRRLSASDHPITLVAAASDDAMTQGMNDLANTCGRSLSFACIETSAGVAVTPEIPVLLNGRQDFVRLGSTIREVLRGAKVDGPPLRVLRMHEGRRVPIRFAPQEKTILAMRLNEGDAVYWRAPGTSQGVQ
jgi:hypothetical protein